jgi:hypothetical protein
MSSALAKQIRRDVAVVRLSEPWATRRLFLCARDFSALTPHAGFLAKQLLEDAPPAGSGK